MKTHSKHPGPRARSARRLILCVLAVPILFLAQAAAPARTAVAGPSGLVAAYGFDAGSGTTVADQSGNGNNGTVANTTWAATGKYGSALQFNGTSSLVTVPDAASLHLTTAMTLEAWVDPSTVNGNWRDVIYKANDNFYLEATSTNGSKPDAGLIAGGSYADAYGTAALPANSWSYLAETYDGATLRLYVNGSQVASTAHTGSISTSTNPLQIGGDSLYGQYFAGMIDEVRIYNTALTATQIQTDQTTPITPSGPTYSVGGSVSGLSGSVVLQDNGGDALSVSANGPFVFATSLASGAAYAVTVKTNPSGQTCTVSGGSGTVGSANVTGVVVACVATPPPAKYSIGGSVSGLSGSVVLQDNGGDDLTVSASGPFTFATQLAGGAAYSVTVKTNPSGQTCSVSGGSGTVGSANVTGVAVACVATPPPVKYSIGGSVSGLSGSVVLQDNGGDDLTVSASGPFTFATQLAGGTAYSVTVKTNPSGQTCTVSGGSGTVGSANVTNVVVTCAAATGPSGLVAAYGFDVGSGTAVADQSGNGNNGTVANTTWAATGKYGKALQFNGTSSLVTVPDAASLHLTTAMTLEAWVDPSTVNGNWRDVIYKANDNFYLEATSSNGSKPDAGLIAGGSYGDAYGTAALPANSWSYLAETYDGATLRLYVNGTQVASTAHTGAISTSTNPLQIGGDSLYGQYFAGMIDEVRIYNTALTATQIQTDQTTPITPSGPTYSVGGSVSGLSGSVVLQDNGGDALSVSANGPFVFATSLASGAAYAVTVKTNPSGQTCSVSNGSGTVGSANVTNVAVSCTTVPTYSIGGSVSGLSGSVVLQDNGGDDLTVSANGPFVFATSLASGAAYAVTVKTNPSGQTCTVSGGSGTVGSANVTNVAVTCTTVPTYSVGGSVSGLSGSVVLQDNGGDALSVSANGPFVFATSLASGAAYAVTVKTNPSGQTCSVSGGSGTVGSANVTGVAVACVATPPPVKYSIGGSVSGLSGSVVLQDNGGDDLTVSANGPFTFATQLAGGAAYSVTVKTNPSGQTCSVSGGSGTVGSANVTGVAVTCAASGSGSSVSDNFNRADGGLGAGWTAVSDGGLVISSQAVLGSSATAGDIRTGESYASDQSSQVEVTSTQLSGGQWMGPAVRMQAGGQVMYLGIYFWNNGVQQLRLYERSAGTWIQLGSSFNCGALAAGTQLQLTAVGSTISFLQNGVTRISVTDASITGGAPGIMTFGTATADNWVGGAATSSGNPTPTFQVVYQGSDANGVASYQVTSTDDGPLPEVLRVLAPTNPAPGVPHNFLYVLPVEAGLATDYGDGLDTLRALDAEDQYNLTIIAPSFNVDPWYADNPNDSNTQYETFMTKDLEPWVTQNLSLSGHEQNWLIGFSKSGIGGQDLLLKHPDLFTLAASWDFPADMSSYDQFGPSSTENYGSDANFQANYRLTPSFLAAHKAPFLTSNRIWIGGYEAFQTDVSDYDALLTSEGIAHSTETPPQLMPHTWDSGWVPTALAALHQDSVKLGP